MCRESWQQTVARMISNGRWEPVPDDGYGDNCHHWELADPVRVRLRMPKMVVCGKRRMVTHVKRKEQSRKRKAFMWKS